MSVWFAPLLKRLLPSRLVHKIKQARLRKVVASFDARTITRQYGGHTLTLHVADPIAAGWYDKDWPELPEIAFLKRGRRLRPGAVVFDLGAHQGIVAMMLALEVGSDGTVVAVEGTGHNIAVAKQNIELNSIGNLTMVHAIASNQADEKIAFSNTLNGAVSGTSEGEKTATVTIDSLAKMHGIPDLIFIDVEGFECQVLAGGVGAIASKADFCIEVHEGCGLEKHGNKETVLAYFPCDDYQCFISFPEGAPFERWVPGASLPEDRFFLIAQAIRSNDIQI